MTKTVFVTIIGRTNAGKSSLLNAIIGEKIASVSSKSQTTRTRITGIKHSLYLWILRGFTSRKIS